MTELKMDKENLDNTIHEVLNLIGNQLVLDADDKITWSVGSTCRATRFTLGNHVYTMMFDGKNYFSLRINSYSTEVM